MTWLTWANMPRTVIRIVAKAHLRSSNLINCHRPDWDIGKGSFFAFQFSHLILHAVLHAVLRLLRILSRFGLPSVCRKTTADRITCISGEPHEALRLQVLLDPFDCRLILVTIPNEDLDC